MRGEGDYEMNPIREIILRNDDICECGHPRAAHDEIKCWVIEPGDRIDPDLPCDCNGFVFWKRNEERQRLKVEEAD